MYLSRVANGEKFQWVEFLACVILAGVIGLIICMAAHSQGINYELSGALSGVGGILGKDCVTLIKSALRKKGFIE